MLDNSLAVTEGRGRDDLHVFTDRPAACHRLPDGHIDFDSPCNVLVRRVANCLHTPRAECRLSVRAAFGGSRSFRTDDGRHVIDDGGYLLLNLGSHVSSELDSARPVEMLNITFEPEFVERSLAALALPDDRLLDSPGCRVTQPVQFIEMRYPHDSLVSPALRRIRERASEGNLPAGWLEEGLHDLLAKMLQAHRGVINEVARMPASRESTRVETYRRLSIARDFMEANYAQPIRLDDVAAVACLSPHHFLRTFKLAYGTTPHQYVTRKRLDRAQWLLANTDTPVTDICMEVGYESLGSFSLLFKGRFGISPSRVRLKHE